MLEPRFEKRLGWPDTPKKLGRKECFTYISEKGIKFDNHNFDMLSGKCLKCPLTISPTLLAKVREREVKKNARPN